MSGQAAPQKLETQVHAERLRKFTSTTVHNLREPVRVIGIYAEVLQSQLQSGSVDDSQRAVDLIRNAANRLQSLLEGLSEFATVSGDGPLTRTAAPLNLVLRHVLQQVHGEAKAAAARIEVSELPDIGGDFDRLVLLFRHLIRNAIQYRGETAPEIAVEARRANGEWLVEVRDNGPGIPSEYREKIFEPYSRLHGSDKPGNGLGLAVCRDIAANHGGRLWVEANPSGGAVFRLTLPDRI